MKHDNQNKPMNWGSRLAGRLWLVACVALAWFALPVVSQAQSCSLPVIVQVESASATRGKIGFNCGGGTCPDRFYLSYFNGSYSKQHSEIEHSISGGIWSDKDIRTLEIKSGIRTEIDPNLTASQQPVTDSESFDGCNYTVASFYATTQDWFYELWTHSYSDKTGDWGGFSWTHEYEGVYENEQIGNPYPPSPPIQDHWEWKVYKGSDLLESYDGDGVGSDFNPSAQSILGSLEDYDNHSITYNTSPKTDECGHIVGGVETSGQGDDVEPYGYGPETYTTIVSVSDEVYDGSQGPMYQDEYTTDMLKNKVRGLAASRAGALGFDTDYPVKSENPYAWTWIGADESCASVGNSKWRAKLTGLIKDEKYWVIYRKVVQEIVGGSTNETVSWISNSITADAPETWYPSAEGETMDVSEWKAGVCPSTPGVALIFYDSFNVVMDVGNGPPPGSGGPGGYGDGGSGGYGDGGNCSTCVGGSGGDGGGSGGGGGGGGGSSGGGGGVHVTVGMGKANGGGSAGAFNLQATAPSASLATPNIVTFSHATDATAGVDVLKNSSGIIEQVLTPQGFAVTVIDSDYKFHINVYKAAAAGTLSGNPPRYTLVNGPANLITTWTFENPDGATANNRLIVTETRGGSSRSWTNEYLESTKEWALWLPDSSGKVVTSRTTDPLTGYYTETTKQYSVDNVLLRQSAVTYGIFPWGSSVVQRSEGDPVGGVETTYYDYYTDFTSTGLNFTPGIGLLKEVRYPHGNWERYEYDTQQRTTKVLSGIDTTPTSTAAQCRTTEYYYTAWSHDDDDATQRPWSPRLVVEKYKGTTVGLTLHAYTATKSTTVRCLNSALTDYATAKTDSSSLVSYDLIDDTTGRTTRSVSSDGTETFYTHAVDTPVAGQETDTYSSGEPNAGGTAVKNGTQTITVTDSEGRMVSRVVKRIENEVVGVVLSSETYSLPDEFDRPTRVTYLDGTYTTTAYSCCGVESFTDRDGSQTSYTYDSLKRVDTITRNGVVTRNKYDAAGRLYAVERLGSNPSVIVLRGAAFNTAGEQVRATNALNGVTYFTESVVNNLHQRTTTSPDLGTTVRLSFQDGSPKSITGTAAFPVYYEYGTDASGFFTKEIKGSAAGTEWVKSYTDLLGRQYKTVYADTTTGTETDNPYSQSYYNSKGQLWKQRDPDGVITLFRYNAEGDQEYQVVALTSTTQGLATYEAMISAWSTLEGGADRISRTVSSVVAGTPNVRRTERYLYVDGSNTPRLVSRSDAATHGNNTWQTVWRDGSTPVTTHSATVINAGAQTRTVTVTGSDSTSTVTVYQGGRLQSSTRKNSSGGQVTSTTYAYDTHGRTLSVTDARNGATTYTYNNADQVRTVTTPDPDGAGPATAQVTTTDYDTSLRAYRVTQPDGGVVNNQYFQNGLLQKTWGARNYPVEYTYDYAGRMKTMKTWQQFNEATGAGISGSAVTTWNYHSQRGWLQSKDYPNATTGAAPTAGTGGPTYTYTFGGRLKTRTWKRGVVTTYSYGFEQSGNSKHGDLVGLAYSNDPQNTPGVTYTYNRLGQQNTVVRSGVTTTMTYNYAGQPTLESWAGGGLNAWSVQSVFDANLRLDNLVASGPSAQQRLVDYGYDSAGRLQTVQEISAVATYSYVPNSPLVSQILFQNGGNTRMTTVKDYDKLNRLKSINSTAHGSTGPASTAPQFVHAYQYNDANQRTKLSLANGAHWDYSYDNLGQVTAGKKRWVDNAPVAGQQFEYAFDEIGNRLSTKAGGDAAGGNLRFADYDVNALNQYERRDVPAAIDVIGAASVASTVTVTDGNNGGGTAERRGAYYRKELSTPNSTGPNWQTVNVNTSGSSKSGHVFVPQSPEVFTHDLDGNLTQDGRWDYTWDAENRLIKLESRAGAPNESKRRLEFGYDWRGRRIWKKVTDLHTSTVTLEENFLYDGWNLAAVINSSSGITKFFAWGLDLSGTFQGAGGVGGLLWVNDSSTVNNQPSTHFTSYDGNGNVVALVYAADDTSTTGVNEAGMASANYEYGPFGEMLRATGPMALANPFRFSTKYQDDETDQLYYGYRFFNASTGRWLSRDLIGENGGVNIYGFVGNNSVLLSDRNGLDWNLPPGGNPYDPWPYLPPTPDTPSSPSDQNYSASGPSVLDAVRRLLPATKGCFSPLSATVLWIPYPGGKADVTVTVSGCIEQCCKKQGGIGLQFVGDITVAATGGLGYGAGGNQGLQQAPGLPGKLRHGKGSSKGGQAARNPEKGFGEPSYEMTYSSGLPSCGATIDGMVTIEVGGKVGAIFTVNPYANVAFAFSDPISFDYGVRTGISTYVGAEIYLQVSGSASGTLPLE